MSYKILQDQTIHGLQRDVEFHLAKGFVPIGGVACLRRSETKAAGMDYPVGSDITVEYEVWTQAVYAPSSPEAKP